MRFFLGFVLTLTLSVLPVAAARAGGANGNSSDAKATDSAASDSSSTTAAVGNTQPAAQPAKTTLDLEVEELREQLQTQSDLLKQQQEKVQALEEQLKTQMSGREALSSSPAATPANATTAAAPVGAVSGLPASATVAASPADAPATPQATGPGESPLQLHIGAASITPVGFSDFTGVWRSRTGGSGIGTNFASIPYGSSTFQGNLSEYRFSMQNSRIGFRVDADVKGAHVLGYMEADFLGNNPGNVAVTSNSNTLRSRLYWVQVRKGAWEVLGGQTWSLITPNRVGISPLPGDLFYSQNMDVNYQVGLVWGRIPELRLVYHPSPKAALAIALDSPEQYVGGSSGGPQITLPSGLAGNAAYSLSAGSAQFNNGNTTLNAPNVAPDVIVKVAFDPSRRAHIEFGGLERQFKVWTPTSNTIFSATGGAGFVNMNFGIAGGFRLLTNNFYSDGGGRYLFGQAPDFVVRPDGSLSLVHALATLSGFEYTKGRTLLFGYWGAYYTERNALTDTNGNSIGYGYAGASASQNRVIQEPSIGFNQIFWRDPKYGALTLIGQYSYLSRNPWSVANGAPRSALLNMVFLDLRYTLPGSAPTLGEH